MPNVAKDLRLEDLLEMVILETGERRDTVENIVSSFLLNFRETVPTKSIYIRGIDVFYTTVETKKYYNCVMPRVKVRFKPVKYFLDIAAEKRKEDLEAAVAASEAAEADEKAAAAL